MLRDYFCVQLIELYEVWISQAEILEELGALELPSLQEQIISCFRTRLLLVTPVRLDWDQLCLDSERLL